MVVEIKIGKTFADSETWKAAHGLVLMVFAATRGFYKVPEQVELANRIRGAATQITEMLAEGFIRESYKEKIKFYENALRSITRLQNFMLIAGGVEYIYAKDFDEIAKQWTKVQKIIGDLVGKNEGKKKA